MSPWLRRACCACLLGLEFVVGAVQAQTVEAGRAAPPDGPVLTLRDAIRTTLASNPGLKVFAYSMRAQQARTAGARLSTPVELSVEAENVLGPGEVRTRDSGEMTLALSKVIELGGKRGARVAVSTLEAAGIGIEQQAAQLDALAEVARRFIHVVADQRHLALTRRGVDLARETLAAVQRRVQAAKSPEAELYRANVDLVRAEVALEHAEHELLTSRSRLAACWGETDPRFSQAADDLDRLPVPLEFGALETSLQRNPDFTRFAAAARLQDAHLRLAQAQRRADVRITAGVRRLEAFDDQALVLGMSWPLGSRSKAQPRIEEARAERSAVDARSAATFIQARTQLFDLYQELRHAITEAEAITGRIMPQMELALQETRYAYERGRYSYLEWADAQRLYVDNQRTYIDAAANAHLFQVEIERLTGEALEPAQLGGATP